MEIPLCVPYVRIQIGRINVSVCGRNFDFFHFFSCNRYGILCWQTTAQHKMWTHFLWHLHKRGDQDNQEVSFM